jgi:heme o synthase
MISLKVQINIKDYLSLTKPGIIRGNLLAALAGFLLASLGKVDIGLLVYTLVGVGLLIASGCVFNNYLDRDIDKKMDRTKQRALVTGKISPKAAIVYGTILGAIGIGVLGIFVNNLTLVLGILAVFFYVIVYGYFKRKGPVGTLVGTISGSASLVAGYTAVTGSLDLTVATLFAAMASWQMAHFYAISIYRLKEYQAANLPVLPAVRGVSYTITQILGFQIGFVLLSVSLYFVANLSITYLVVITLLSLWWLVDSLRRMPVMDNVVWAKRVFSKSLITLLIWSVLLGADHWLP